MGAGSSVEGGRDGSVFRKSRTDVDPDFFAAEAAGLRWLADAGAPVVEVLSVSTTAIELRTLARAAPTAPTARDYGRRLASMHDAGAASFGAPPEGFTGRQFIGERTLATGNYARWGEFYATTRVEPYLAPAVAAGFLDVAEARLVEQACAVISDGTFDDGDAPARIHGDLWSGNVMWTPDGVVMIDPAAHGGHRETDLAMLALFGCPQLREVLEGYGEQHPLRPGFAGRIALHQLHPLAVHAAGHGRSYGIELARAATSVLAVAAQT